MLAFIREGGRPVVVSFVCWCDVAWMIRQLLDRGRVACFMIYEIGIRNCISICRMDARRQSVPVGRSAVGVKRVGFCLWQKWIPRRNGGESAEIPISRP